MGGSRREWEGVVESGIKWQGGRGVGGSHGDWKGVRWMEYDVGSYMEGVKWREYGGSKILGVILRD